MDVLDSFLLLFLQEHVRQAFLTPFFVFLTTLGNKGALWFAICFALLLFPRTRRAGVLALLSLLLAGGIGHFVMKPLLMRPRPFLELGTLVPLVAKPLTYSFPSGHTACGFAVALILLRAWRRWYRWLALALAVLIAFSRLYVGVHYPSDVLGGFLLACLVSSLVWRFLGEGVEQPAKS